MAQLNLLDKLKLINKGCYFLPAKYKKNQNSTNCLENQFNYIINCSSPIDNNRFRTNLLYFPYIQRCVFRSTKCKIIEQEFIMLVNE